MRNIIADTIEKIKGEHIRPEPRWKYLAKKYSVWTSFFAIAIIGATAFSVAYFLVSQLDWDLFSAAHRFSFFYYLALVPFLWIIPLIILAFFAFFALRKTENGYRYDFSKIAAAVLGTILVFGFLTALAGFGGKMNGAMTRGFPGYGKLVATKESQWSQPEEGLLAGTINSVSGNSIDLRDFLGKEWQINIDEKTVVRPMANLESGAMIKAIGQQKDAHTFKADEIRPWQGKGLMGRGAMNGKQK